MWTVFLTVMVTVPRWTPQSGTSATEPGPLACRSGGDSDGHVPRDWFRVQVWKPACATAKLGIKVTVRDLRHAHASWLLAGGADLQVVKERPWPCPDLHHREVPPHPARCGRVCGGRLHRDPAPPLGSV